MKNIALVITGLLLSSCVSMDEIGTALDMTGVSYILQPAYENAADIDMQTTKTAKSGDIIFKQEVAPSLVRIQSEYSYKGRNQLSGMFGPKGTYVLEADELFYQVIGRGIPGKTYCRIKQKMSFQTCLRDTDKDGLFDHTYVFIPTFNKKQKLMYKNGSISEPKAIDTPIPYVAAKSPRKIYYGIKFYGKKRPKFSRAIYSEDGKSLVPALGSIKSPKEQSPPYIIAVDGVDIDVISHDNGVLKYQINSLLSRTGGLTVR